MWTGRSTRAHGHKWFSLNDNGSAKAWYALRMRGYGAFCGENPAVSYWSTLKFWPAPSVPDGFNVNAASAVAACAPDIKSVDPVRTIGEETSDASSAIGQSMPRIAKHKSKGRYVRMQQEGPSLDWFTNQANCTIPAASPTEGVLEIFLDLRTNLHEIESMGTMEHDKAFMLSIAKCWPLQYTEEI